MQQRRLKILGAATKPSMYTQDGRDDPIPMFLTKKSCIFWAELGEKQRNKDLLDSSNKVIRSSPVTPIKKILKQEMALGLSSNQSVAIRYSITEFQKQTQITSEDLKTMSHRPSQ